MNIKWIVFIFLVLLLLGAGGFFGYQYFMQNKVPAAEEITNMSDEERKLVEKEWLAGYKEQELVFDPTPENMAVMMFLYEGSFSNVGDKKASGRVHLYRDQDGSYIVRVKGLSVEKAPELNLILSDHPLPSTYAQANENETLVVGKLKSHGGDHTYRFNADMVSQYGSLVVVSPFQTLYGVVGLR